MLKICVNPTAAGSIAAVRCQRCGRADRWLEMRRLYAVRSAVIAATLLLAAGSLTAFRAWGAPADPPARVGRISAVTGSAALRYFDTGASFDAALNIPVTTHTEIATLPGARLEVSVGATFVRLDGDSDIGVLLLDDTRLQIQLNRGSVSVHAFDQGEAEGVEILLPEGSVTLLNTGSYRFDTGTTVDGQALSAVTVFGGTAAFTSEATVLNVTEGQRAQLFGADPVSYMVGGAQSDAFDAWAAARDQGDAAPAALRYVAPDMTGYESLDPYGTWQQTDDGAMWVPDSVPAGWAPYGDGQWAWVAPWGWTWIDAAPWGFAPFHYGRWRNERGRWGWLPGPYRPRPVYAPALVGWLGAGSRPAGSSLPAGWFPLAPHEPYTPAFAASKAWLGGVNPAVRSAETPGPVKYRYASLRQAVTLAPAGALSAGTRIARAPAGPDAGVLAGVQVIAGPPRAAPAEPSVARTRVAFVPWAPQGGFRRPDVRTAAAPPPPPRAATQIAARTPSVPIDAGRSLPAGVRGPVAPGAPLAGSHYPRPAGPSAFERGPAPPRAVPPGLAAPAAGLVPGAPGILPRPPGIAPPAPGIMPPAPFIVESTLPPPGMPPPRGPAPPHPSGGGPAAARAAGEGHPAHGEGHR